MELTIGKISDIVSVSRPTGGSYWDRNGLLRWAAVDEWRRDHDPMAREPLGVLVETARTNQLMWSEAFDSAAWGKSLVNVVPSEELAPDGLTGMQVVVEDVGNGLHTLSQYVPGSTAVGYTGTISVFAKAAGRRCIALTAFGEGSVIFDLVDGVVLSQGTSGADIEHVGNGVYRCSATIERADPSENGHWYILLADGGALAYEGDGVSGVYLWGAQLETGLFPTSYIPTADQQKTRAADSLVVMTEEWLNPYEGTLLIEGASHLPPTYGYWQIISDIGADGAFGTTTYVARSGGSYSLFSNEISIVANENSSVFKLAAAFRRNAMALSVNGLPPLEDVSAEMPVSQSKLRIGFSQWAAGAAMLQGHIKRVTYFPRRMSNAELQELTS